MESTIAARKERTSVLDPIETSKNCPLCKKTKLLFAIKHSNIGRGSSIGYTGTYSCPDVQCGYSEIGALEPGSKERSEIAKNLLK